MMIRAREILDPNNETEYNIFARVGGLRKIHIFQPATAYIPKGDFI